jgi:multiple sugar transport system substrate-binding protein
MLKRETEDSKLDCSHIDALLGAYLEGGLPPDRAAAVAAHLEHCLDCRHAVKQDAQVASRLRMEVAWQRKQLSPGAAARIQQRAYRRMRRSIVTRRVNRLAWGAVGLVVLALVALGASIWWQQRPVGLHVTPGTTDMLSIVIGTATPTPTVGPTRTPRLPTATPHPARSDAVVVTFACSEGQLAHYQALTEAFHQENPTVEVQVVASDAVFGNEAGDLQALAASADTFALQRSLAPGDIRSGLLRDLQPLVDADRVFDAGDFYPGLLDRYRWQGGLWGLPSPGTPLLLFYDRAAFDEAGLPYPEPGWSFDAFETAAGVLTRDQGDGATRYGLVVSPHSLAGPLLVMGRAEGWAGGASALSEPVLDAPAVVEAAGWFVDLARARGEMPNPYELEDGQVPFVVAQVQEGRAALWDGWPGTYVMQAYRDAYGDVGVTTFPEGTPLSEWAATSPYLVSAGTAHPGEAWRWLRFLTYQPGDVAEVRPPVRRSVAASTGYWNQLGPDLSPAVRYVMERPKTALPPGMLASLRGALESLLTGTGNEDVPTVLARAREDLAGALGAPAGQAAPRPVATPRPEPAAGEGVTVEFAVRNYWELQKAYERLAGEFHQLHPGITVKPKSPAYEQGNQTITLPWLATQGDCFEYFYPLVDEPESVVLSLDPLLAADATLAADGFYPQLLDRFYREGHLWAFPAEVYPRVMYYNKALFDRAGLAYPSPGWTLDDFVAAATALAEGEGAARQYGYTPDPPLNDVWFFLAQQGIPFSGSGTGRLEDPQTVEAIRWYVGLWEAGIVPQYELSAPGEYDSAMDARNRALWESLISRGKVAMWSTYPGLGHSHYEVWKDLDVGLVPMPQGPGQVADLNLSGYYISAQAEHPQACWQWFTFLSGKVGMIQGVPARPSVATSNEYRHQLGAETADVYLATLETSQQVIGPGHIYWDSYQGRILQAVILALQGMDVGQALQQVQE